MSTNIYNKNFTLLMWCVLLPTLALTLLSMESMIMSIMVSPKSSYDMEMYFYMDPFTASFLITLMLVSMTILIYSEYYMENNIYQGFYKFMLNMFIVSMVLMAMSPHVITLILGWDGLGLTSYLVMIKT